MIIDVVEDRLHDHRTDIVFALSGARPTMQHKGYEGRVDSNAARLPALPVAEHRTIGIGATTQAQHEDDRSSELP